MKIQIKEMFETVGKDENGKAIRQKIGTLFCESVKGRLQSVIDAHGVEFLEDLIDNQVLHHPASATFKAKAGKTDSSAGLDKLGWEPKASRQLYRRPWNSVQTDTELPKGFDPDEVDVVCVNWAFKPGSSAAAEKAAELKARFEDGVTAQLGLFEASGIAVTDEMRAKVEALVRKNVYGG